MLFLSIFQTSMHQFVNKILNKTTKKNIIDLKFIFQFKSSFYTIPNGMIIIDKHTFQKSSMGNHQMKNHTTSNIQFIKNTQNKNPYS